MSRLIVDQHGGSGGGVQPCGDLINGAGLNRHVIGQAPSELPGDHPVADLDSIDARACRVHGARDLPARHIGERGPDLIAALYDQAIDEAKGCRFNLEPDLTLGGLRDLALASG